MELKHSEYMISHAQTASHRLGWHLHLLLFFLVRIGAYRQLIATSILLAGKTEHKCTLSSESTLNLIALSGLTNTCNAEIS